jgi:hypothetical protein
MNSLHKAASRTRTKLKEKKKVLLCKVDKNSGWESLK